MLLCFVVKHNKKSFITTDATDATDDGTGYT